MAPDSDLLWKLPEYARAMAALFRLRGLPTLRAEIPRPPVAKGAGLHALYMAAWTRRVARDAGLEATIDRVDGHDLAGWVRRARGVKLLGIPGDPWSFLIVSFDAGSSALVIRPDDREIRVSRKRIFELIVRAAAKSVGATRWVVSGVPGAEHALDRTFARGFGAAAISIASFELDAAHPLQRQIGVQGGWRAMAAHVGLSLVRGTVAVGAMWTLGSTALNAKIDVGRVVGWAMLALSDAPLQFLSTRMLGAFTVDFSKSLKSRLLEGTFYISERDVRSQGFGALLARANESSIVEQLSLAEVSSALVGLAQIVCAGFLLHLGVYPVAAVIVLLATLVTSGALVAAIVRTYRALYVDRVGLTDDIVEKIVAYRTRSVQEARARYHLEEDTSLVDYMRLARRYDRLGTLFDIFGRGWMIVAALVLFIGFIREAPVEQLFFSGLGIMLAYAGFLQFPLAVERAVEWVAAGQGVLPLLIAGRSRDLPTRNVDTELENVSLPVALSMSAVSHTHTGGSRPILSDVNLTLRQGEKVLLEGSSGSGKTTLLKVIAGEVRHSNGVVLVGGSDCYSVSGREWRRRVGSAPQFHENFIFTNSLAFNLDPTGTASFAPDEALAICEELGLGDLIARMPQGMKQTLGETGWQLSHGERSRIFIARALLQKSDLLLFDESFGALDPETLLVALDCVRRRAKTLVVIAHV